MRKIYLVILTIFLLAGCSFWNSSKPNNESGGVQKPTEQTDGGTETSGDKEEIDGEKDKPVSNNSGNGPGGKPGTGTDGSSGGKPTGEGANGENDRPIETGSYFPEGNKIKTFKGTGNEFASEVEHVFTKEGKYIATITDNGGTRMLRIYNLGKKGISIVYEEPEYYSEDAPSIENYKAAFKEQLVLPNPIKLKQSFDGWVVKEIDATISVPYGKISKVIVLEKIGTDGSIVENYWAPRLGIVKKTLYLKDSTGNEMSVTTELEKIENLP
ncbi:hypothetical protein [Bacillus sp. EB01]|uniref:hypothetical protein n=1 Tax=Bacillus sp. EB01 TaxID=1347086 RepID=UPI0005C639F4|nr:hypothetical protein [Bacillus sp. EB01]